MADMRQLAQSCKEDLIKAAHEADEEGMTPSEEDIGVYGASLSSLEISLVLGSSVTLFLSVSPMGQAIQGRIESSGFSGQHVEPLEGEDLDTIASLFDARIIDATEKLLAARVGL